MDPTSAQRGPAPMVWAFVVQEATDGSLLAEAIVQVDEASHDLLLEDAYDSGFTITAGDPPQTTAVVHVRPESPAGDRLQGGRLTRLILGQDHVWEPLPPPQVSPGWLSAARDRQEVALIVVPPDTWPEDLPEREPDESREIFRAGLEEARTSGMALHGMALLNTE
jgi:hypothetical protein